MSGYVYEITNNVNGKKYIGVSMKCDDENIQNYYGSGIAVISAIKKYGKQNFTKTILKEFDSEHEAREYEKYLIEELNAVDDSLYYNLVAGGYGGSVKGRVVSEETKRKISDSLKGHKGPEHSEEHKLYMSEIMKGRKSPMKGRSQSEESKEKIGEASKRMWEKRRKLGITFSGSKHKIVTCPHCKKSGGEGAMKRWHFDKCKTK